MKTIYDYLKQYGDHTFLEKEFNEIDSVILSLISYVDFYGIVPDFYEGKIPLKEASKIFFTKNSEKEIEQNIFSVKRAIHLLQKLENTKRFGDLLLYNYEYKVTFDMQFGALCILLPNHSMYVSFEGTDQHISGWEEDCMFAYQFPTKAQKEAIIYLNKAVGIFSPKCYVGGHSKGGNLAIVSAMYCKKRVRRKIKAIYNNDGPGLRKNEFMSKEYQKILPKLKTFVPKESFIGMLLNHDTNYHVVDSKSKKFLQHDAMSWIVEDDHFKVAKISGFSKKVEKGMANWLTKMNDQDLEKFFDAFFTVLKKAEITDLSEFKKAKLNTTVKIIKEMKSMNKETKETILSCFKSIIEEMKG